MKIKRLIQELFQKFSGSFKRFPVALFFAAATVAALMVHNHTDYHQRDLREILERLSMILAMGLPMSLIVTLFWESIPGRPKEREFLSYGGVVILLTLGYFFLLPEMGMVQVTRYTGYMMTLFLLFLMVPCRHDFEGFEAYVVRLFTAFFVTYLYSGILYGGLAGILGAIHILFEVTIPSRLYFDIFLVVSGIVAPAVFLAEVPRHRDEMAGYEYSKVLKVLILYIVTPLLVAYTVILYSFFFRILVIREWPRNLVSHLVVWYSIFTAVTLFLSVPLRKSHPWARTFGRWMPAVIMIPLGILFAAIGVRIYAYGFTEPRYFLLITGLWLTGSMVHYLVGFQKGQHLPIVAALAAVIFLSVTGPWSGYAVSRWSQSGRFEDLAAEYQLRGPDGEIQPNPQVPEEDQKTISSILQYFERYHEVERLGGLPEDFQVRDMEAVFGFGPIYDYGIPWEERDYFYLGRVEDAGVVEIGQYDYMTSLNAYMRQETTPSAEGLAVIFHGDSRQIRVLEGDTVLYAKNLEDMVDPIVQEAGIGRQEPVPREQMAFTDETETVKVMVVFRYLSGSMNRNTNRAEVEGAEMEVFFTLK